VSLKVHAQPDQLPDWEVVRKLLQQQRPVVAVVPQIRKHLRECC
jgi:hypothetical protein